MYYCLSELLTHLLSRSPLHNMSDIFHIKKEYDLTSANHAFHCHSFFQNVFVHRIYNIVVQEKKNNIDVPAVDRHYLLHMQNDVFGFVLFLPTEEQFHISLPRTSEIQYSYT